MPRVHSATDWCKLSSGRWTEGWSGRASGASELVLKKAFDRLGWAAMPVYTVGWNGVHRLQFTVRKPAAPGRVEEAEAALLRRGFLSNNSV